MNVIRVKMIYNIVLYNVCSILHSRIVYICVFTIFYTSTVSVTHLRIHGRYARERARACVCACMYVMMMMNKRVGATLELDRTRLRISTYRLS